MTKSYTKEDKEEDNNRKSSPTKAYRNAENNARMIRDIIRHHLERTTGGSGKICVVFLVSCLLPLFSHLINFSNILFK